LTTKDTESTEGLLAKHRVNGMDSPWKSDGSCLWLVEPTDRRASHPYPGVSLGAAAPRAERGLSGVRRDRDDRYDGDPFFC
jgi:hypothetical protein